MLWDRDDELGTARHWLVDSWLAGAVLWSSFKLGSALAAAKNTEWREEHCCTTLTSTPDFQISSLFRGVSAIVTKLKALPTAHTHVYSMHLFKQLALVFWLLLNIALNYLLKRTCDATGFNFYSSYGMWQELVGHSNPFCQIINYGWRRLEITYHRPTIS